MPDLLTAAELAEIEKWYGGCTTKDRGHDHRAVATIRALAEAIIRYTDAEAAALQAHTTTTPSPEPWDTAQERWNAVATIQDEMVALARRVLGAGGKGG